MATRSTSTRTPFESSRCLVDMVGADAIFAEGRRAIDAAAYRWAV
ncbi:hypothetical protein ACWD7Y_25660 [Streptomyces drozdowiczii]